ncbi:MAG: two-component regulator propeller domain-containing protein, partial [Vicinamibacterales bacterium]
MNSPKSDIACLVAAVWLVAAGPALALPPGKALTQLAHDVWQTELGLTQNYINYIVQTRDGYLWLGTEEGLVRFD